MEESKEKPEKKISPLTTESVKGVSRIGTSSVGGGDMSTMDEALGQIFVILKRIDKFDRLQNEKQLVDLQISQLEETDRNQKLIEALRGLPKKPKGKRKRKLSPEEEKQRQQIKEEKSKPQPSEPSKTTGQPPKTTQAPATTGQPPKTTGQPATQQQPPKTTQAPATTGQPVTQQQAPATTQAPTTTPVKPPAPATTQAPTTTPVKPPASTPSTAVKVATGAAVIGGLLMPSETVATAIDKASDMVGVPRPLMYAMAKQESGFKADAAAGTSSAKGLYQFIKGTWDGMVKKYGEKYPILKQKGPEDAEANAIAGALYIKENSQILEKAKIPVNATTIYTAHFLGPGGAKKLFSLPPDAIAAETLPDAAKANAFIFYKKDPKGKKIDMESPRTVKEVSDVLFEKVGQYEEKYKKALNISSNTSGTQIDQSSSANRDMKADANAQQPAPVNVNNTYENKKSSPSSGGGGGSDDTNPYERKKNQ